MTSVFARPDGVRQGIGIKPAGVRTAALTDTSSVINPTGDTIRVQFASGMTVSGRIRFGFNDGQRLALVCSLNPSFARITNAPANNVSLDLEQLVDDWVPFPGDTLSLLWDARFSLWREVGRAVNG